MKTWKVFFVVFLMGHALASQAQSPKTVDCQTLTFEGVFIPCLGEFVTGEYEVCTIVWKNKVQLKVSGFLTGETTGNLYTMSQVSNMIGGLIRSKKAENYTNVLNANICLDGVPVYTIHIFYHYTINANGEWVAMVFDVVEECF
jgi:hypothetical protein